MATRMQRRLVGEGAGERREKVNRLERDWKAMLAGETWDRETLAEGMREMYRKVAILIIGSTIDKRTLYRDVARERARLGGDWAIAGVILNSSMRQIARFFSTDSSH